MEGEDDVEEARRARQRDAPVGLSSGHVRCAPLPDSWCHVPAEVTCFKEHVASHRYNFI